MQKTPHVDAAFIGTKVQGQPLPEKGERASGPHGCCHAGEGGPPLPR